MSLRTLASLALAIFLGLVAVLIVRGAMTRQKPVAGQVAATTPVVVALTPIERGVELKPDMLKVVGYPNNSVPAGAFHSPEQLFGKGGPPRVTVRSLTANEPVLTNKVSGPDNKGTLSASLTQGMRAVSIRSSDVVGVGGYVLPGDHVDILLTRTVGKGDAETTVTEVLASNSLVLGVDQESSQDADKPLVAKAVTVEVTPDQALKIPLGQTVGQVSLSLRNHADAGPTTQTLISIADLGGPRARKATPVRRAAAPVRPTGLTEVKVTRGVETSGYSVRAF